MSSAIWQIVRVCFKILTCIQVGLIHNMLDFLPIVITFIALILLNYYYIKISLKKNKHCFNYVIFKGQDEGTQTLDTGRRRRSERKWGLLGQG